MEKNDNEKMIKDLLDNLLQLEFYDLKEEDINKYNLEDILNEEKQENNSNKLTSNNNIIEEKEKKNNLITQTQNSSSSEESDVLSAKDIPKEFLSNPIDFVNYIECEYPKIKMKKIKNEFILKKYEETNQTKFEILNINKDEKLNKVIFPENELLTTIYYYEERIVTGNIFGQVKIFSLLDKKQLKFFPCPIELENYLNVTSVDISNDYKHIFIGYSNGNIAIYEINSQKIRLLINDIINNCECLCIKFISKQGKIFKIISSDQAGNVFLINLKDGMTGFKVVEKQTIYNNKNYPVYLLRPIEFDEKFLKRFSFLKNLKKYIIFGTLKNIQIYSLSDNLKDLKIELEKPRWIQDDYIVGDISFGVGKHPQSRESQGEDEDEPQILIVTSFDNVISLYLVPIDNGELTNNILIGHYLNFNKNGNNEIIRVGFLAKGAIFLIDKNNYLKILNTRKFIRGTPDIDEVTLYPKKEIKYDIAELQEVFRFDSEINMQINLKTPNHNYRQTYMNSIVQNFDNQKIAISSINCIYILELIDYADCLRKLQQKEKWMDLFILGIKIYKGQIVCLKGIPNNAEERKKKLRDHLQQLISFYIMSEDMNQNKKGNGARRNSFYENQENLKHTENTIEIIIEFCSEIEGFEFLLDKILIMYEAKGYGDLFLSKLESFILCDKILKYEISEDLILKLIQLYEEKNKANILNKLLLHIDIKSLCTQAVNSKIIELSLLSPMINIFVNGKNPDYFKPILKMYELYQISKPLNFNSYEKIIESKKLLEILNSKEYKGHKILWYIKNCFIRRKYPYFIENMEEKEFSEFIIDLIFWLMKENIMKDLMEFDSGIYFEILNKIFEDQRNLDIINAYNSNFDIVKKKLRNLNEQNYNYAYKDLSPFSLLNYIIDQGKKIKGNKKIQLDFNLFITQSFKKNTQLSKDIMLNSITYILSEYSFVNEEPIESKIKNIIINIINILNNAKFTESDYQNILLCSNDHIFDEVKVFIYEKIKEYKNCLDIYVNKKCIIFDKENKLYNYIDKTLTLLYKDKDNENNFLDFKNVVIENMINIGEISCNKMLEIIDKWLNNDKNDQKKLIETLSKNPKLQILYVEKLSNIFIEEFNEDVNNIPSEDKDFASSTLGLYIQLLCILDRKKEILKKLKGCLLYPIDFCTKICEEYCIKDSLIYLYQLSGGFQNALKMSLKIIDENYESLIKNITSDIFKNKEFDEQISNFNKSINESLEILIKIQSFNKSKDSNETDYLWFQILDKLYDISIDYDKKFEKMSNNRKLFGVLFEESITDNIKDVLEKMSIYIGVRRILNVVSQKNKEAGYKEFKPLLLKIFETYDNQSFILNSVGRLLINLCFENINKFKIINLEGKSLNLLNCNVCGENFSHQNKDNKKILIFKCDHIMHYSCSFMEIYNNMNIFVCPICRKNEVDNAISSLSLPIMGRKQSSTQNKIIEIETKKKLNKYKIDISIYKKGLNKIKNIDINTTTKNKAFIEESYKACKSDYRKNY